MSQSKLQNNHNVLKEAIVNSSYSNIPKFCLTPSKANSSRLISKLDENKKTFNEDKVQVQKSSAQQENASTNNNTLKSGLNTINKAKIVNQNAQPTKITSKSENSKTAIEKPKIIKRHIMLSNLGINKNAQLETKNIGK